MIDRKRAADDRLRSNIQRAARLAPAAQKMNNGHMAPRRQQADAVTGVAPLFRAPLAAGAAPIARGGLLIGELKALRRRLGWSVIELSDRVGIDRQTLHEWEQGIRRPQLDNLEAWAAALGMRLTMSPARAATNSGLQIDWAGRRVMVDGATVRLTVMEWKAMECLAANPGQVVTHQALWRHLYGDNRPDQASSTAMRVLICRLRRVLPVSIKSHWGRGYTIEGMVSPSGSAGRDQSADVGRPQATTKELGLQQRALQREARRLQDDTRYKEPSASTAQPVRLPGQRIEELQAIERFLADRGATLCPDLAGLQQSPLPALVRDQTTRKWKRPLPSADASL